MEAIRQRARAAYLGLAIGDALGATTEFMLPREIQSTYGLHRDIIGGGWLRLKAGRVTDDTEMALALGRALIARQGCDARAIADSFIHWMRSRPADIGSTIRRGLRQYLATGSPEADYSPNAAGNGAAMRNLPVVIATLFDDTALRRWTLAQARVTHHNGESDFGTLMLGELTRGAILHGQASPLQSRGAALAAQNPRFDWRTFKGETSGYIVDTVRVALHFFFNTYDFESCLIGVVNQGGDADTNAALAGQIAGAFYGLDAIPRRWLKKLDPLTREEVGRQADLLVDLALARQNSTVSDT